MTWIDDLRQRLAVLEPEDLPEIAPGTPAAVLVPLFVKDGELHLLLTKRSDSVEHHKGQIAFPGGVCEEDDDDVCATALRETFEEVGIDPAKVLILGRLDERLTVTGFRVTPWVGVIPWPVELRPHAGEIADVMEVPLGALLDPRRREERTVKWEGTDRKVLYYHWGEAPIWGATARMIEELSEVLGAPGAPS